MKSISKFLFLFALALLALLDAQAAPKIEKQKTIKAVYQASAQTQLLVANKFGKIEIKPSTNNEIEVVVTVKAWAKNPDDAQESLDRIAIAHKREGLNVRFDTFIGEARRNVANDYEINYSISAPSYVLFSIQNQFGSVFIDKSDKQVELNLRHGNFNANTLLGTKNQINVKHGNATIGEVEQAQINVAHGNTQVQKAQKLSIESRHGNVRLTEVVSAHIENSHGNLRIGTAQEVEAKVRFGNATVEQVRKKIILNSTHGNSQVGLLEQGFEQAQIEASFGNVSLAIAANTGYEYNVKSQFGNINNRLTQYQHSLCLTEGNSQTIKGSVSGKGNGKLEVVAKHGNVKLR
jgi:hypothetical protein